VATVAALADRVLSELARIVGTQHVLTSRTARLNRARTPAMFAVHRWEEYVPQVVVLPATADEVSEIIRLANRERIPVVPRAGGTGLVDGAVPLQHGILVDIKRMDAVLEVDLDERTVTVGPGVNMQKLNELLRPHGVMYPDNPASYSCALVGGRIGTNGWSLLGSRFGHVRNLVISFEIVLPTGEIIRVGEGGGLKTRSSSSGYRLKELFMGAQGTLGIVTEATLELVKRPEAEFSAFWMQRSFDTAWRTGGELMRSGFATIAGVMLFDERKVTYLRRDDEAYIPQPDWATAVVAFALYGNRAEVRPAAKEMMRIAKASGGE
jgi:glycolate oxidase